MTQRIRQTRPHSLFLIVSSRRVCVGRDRCRGVPGRNDTHAFSIPVHYDSDTGSLRRIHHSLWPSIWCVGNFCSVPYIQKTSIWECKGKQLGSFPIVVVGEGFWRGWVIVFPTRDYSTFPFGTWRVDVGFANIWGLQLSSSCLYYKKEEGGGEGTCASPT